MKKRHAASFVRGIMFSSDSAASETPPSDESVTAQAEELAWLRQRVAVAQAENGVIDPALVAEFAAAQRAFLDAKIQLERMRMAGLLDTGSPDEYVPEEIAPEEAAIPEASEQQAERIGRRILTASSDFWVTVIVLLTAFVCFQHSPFSFE
jgi:hypothetical protein